MPMHPYVQGYLDILEKEHRGSNADRIAHGILMGFLVLLGLIGIALFVISLISGKPSFPGVGLLPLALGGAYYRQYRKNKKYAEKVAFARRAVPVRARLVQANMRLFQPGPGQEVLACLVLFSFDIDGASAQMENLAVRMSALKDSAPPQADLQYVRRLVADERAVEYQRKRLPPSFTGDAVVYAGDLFILRRHLRRGYLTEPCFLCLAERGESGRIELIPWQVAERNLSGQTAQAMSLPR